MFGWNLFDEGEVERTKQCRCSMREEEKGRSLAEELIGGIKRRDPALSAKLPGFRRCTPKCPLQDIPTLYMGALCSTVFSA